ncbi:MAG TPA: thioredoxin [Isosphaeraceae bacterium]|nr:thioredoxin [Isosphaeraceae bacterium]
MSDTKAAPQSSPYVIDVTSASFAEAILDQSQALPVVIDFWAPWCGPCRLLSPVLEKLADEYGGRFLLAKVNIDESPDVAAKFAVRSIPAVFAVRNGKVTDGFVGVQPESAIRMWIDRLLPTEAELLTAAAASLENSDPRAAEERYSQAIALEPDLPQAQIGLARVALADGHFEDAAARLARLEQRGFLEPEAEKLKAELTLRVQARGADSVETARTAMAASPEDLQLKLKLAEALAAAGQYADALALCLELVERDRKGVGEPARQTMVAIFQLLPPGHDLATEYQRQLSLVLS